MNCNVKDVVNGVINDYVHRPWHIYTKIISKYEVDIVCINEHMAVKLSCRTWQDNYFNELAERARLDLYIYYMEDKKGDHLYISSQYVPLWDEQPNSDYRIIEKVIRYFNEIYYSRLNNIEFYNRDWTI